MRFLSLLPLLCLIACSDSQNDSASKEGAAPAETSSMSDLADSPAALLPQYDLQAGPALPLPHELEEISGLAVAPDGRLFGHNDEEGTVFRIDAGSGAIVERFSLGAIGAQDDFEGIEIVGERFFLLSSDGELYEFREGKDGGRVDFTTIKTGLSGKYDVEGICADPATNDLLLVCKEYPGKGYAEDDEKAVYAFALATGALNPEPRFVLPAKKIRKALGLKKFKPSGIARHPESGSFFIISSSDPAIVEISSDGTLLAARKLPASLAQPEGIAFDADGRLYIGSEGGRLFVPERQKR